MSATPAITNKSNLLIVYLWKEEHGEDAYKEIKAYGLDNVEPCRINCVEITDVHANQWLKNNAAQIDASKLSCFLLTERDGGITAVIPVERKNEVYRLVVGHYM